MEPSAREAENRRTGARAGAETDRIGGRSDEYPLQDWGCVHGRFQPFHNGHLEYVLRAKGRCRRLVVGITNPDPTWVQTEAANPRRHEPEANPFTYLERALMVGDVLLAEGLSPREFVVVPFPIQDPGLCGHYAPPGAVHYVRIYSGWEEEKVRRLRAAGLAVEVLDPDKEKEVSGAEVRRLMRDGLPWEHLVPEAVADIVRPMLAAHEDRRRAP